VSTGERRNRTFPTGCLDLVGRLVNSGSACGRAGLGGLSGKYGGGPALMLSTSLNSSGVIRALPDASSSWWGICCRLKAGTRRARESADPHSGEFQPCGGVPLYVLRAGLGDRRQSLARILGALVLRRDARETRKSRLVDFLIHGLVFVVAIRSRGCLQRGCARTFCPETKVDKGGPDRHRLGLWLCGSSSAALIRVFHGGDRLSSPGHRGGPRCRSVIGFGCKYSVRNFCLGHHICLRASGGEGRLDRGGWRDGQVRQISWLSHHADVLRTAPGCDRAECEY